MAPFRGGPARSAARLRLHSAYSLLPPEPRQVPRQPNPRYPEKFPLNGKLQKERYTPYFYLTSGYFAPQSHETPLIHTWSLAVEEQYYLLFPVMIVLLWSWGQKWLIFSIALLATISLLIAQSLSSRFVDANFYLIFSRAWELLLGSLLAFRQFHFARWQREFLGIAGLVMIIYSIASFGSHTPFPSLYTLIPVLGTCLVIAFVDSPSLVGRLLSNSLFVSIGLLSYSLYLWHQPVFAFLRLTSIGAPSGNLFFLAAATTFALAAFSWKYVERPFRNKLRFSRKSIFQFSLASIFIFSSIGLAGHLFKGFGQRFDARIESDSTKHSPKRIECHQGPGNHSGPESACTYFGKDITWAALGDSHAVELAYALATRLKRYDKGLLHLSFSACPPALLFEAKRNGCTEWVRECVEYLENSQTIDNVLLTFRHSSYLYGHDHLAYYPDLPNVDPAESQFADSFRRSFSGDAREAYWQSFKAIVLRLLRAEKTVYVVYPFPELPAPISFAVIPFTVFESATRVDLDRAVSAKYYFDRNGFIVDKLDSLPYGDNLHAIKPFEILCDGAYCPAVIDRKALYFDAHHPSLIGAKLLVENIELDRE